MFKNSILIIQIIFIFKGLCLPAVNETTTIASAENINGEIIYPEDAGIFPHDFGRRAISHGAAVLKHIFLLDATIRDEDEVKYYLYTRSNRKVRQELKYNNITSIKRSNFFKNKRNLFIIHGWTDNADHDVFIYMLKELLKTENLNIILVDWRHLSAQLYPIATQNVHKIGNLVTRFILYLMKMKYVNAKDIHLVGHSLGAQISGIIGHNFDGRIDRITGLDPAGPLFEFWDPNPDIHNLDRADAQFVDIIHTSSDDFGVKNPIGHIDFYPNEGLNPQNGCDSILSMVSCSHVRAIQYFTESINTKVGFWSTPCDGWIPYLLKKCDNREEVLMGYWTPRNSTGSYYLKTHPTAPFAMGKNIKNN